MSVVWNGSGPFIPVRLVAQLNPCEPVVKFGAVLSHIPVFRKNDFTLSPGDGANRRDHGGCAATSGFLKLEKLFGFYLTVFRFQPDFLSQGY